MFPTTTILTKDRVFVPVPKELEVSLLITNGAKEFYIRFDTIPLEKVPVWRKRRRPG
jgi:molecular chaperone HtpG